MTIDRHFLETVPASIFVAAILYFRFRRRFQYSWGWRIVISAVLAVGTAPIIFPDMAGGFSVPHFFPMIMFLPAAFADPTLYSFAGIAAGLLDFVLPFVATLAFMVFLWFAFIRLMSRYEKPAA